MGKEYEFSAILLNFINIVKVDPCIGPAHISIFLAILAIYQPVYGLPVSIRLSELIKIAKVSKSTFHRAIKDLQAGGYIAYDPSFNPCKESTITLINRKK